MSAPESPVTSARAVPVSDRAIRYRKHTLGNVRLRDQGTNALILIPTPSRDPNDPLNWPQWRKYYTAGLVCLAMTMSNFLAGGPSVAIVATALSFFPDSAADGTLVTSSIPKVAYFFTAVSLIQGVGCFFWVPMANKYGRRPVYLASYLVYFGATLWLIFEKSYAGFLAGRIVMGFGAGAAETIAPITISDVFFLHERGAVMALYNCALSVGVALGMIISGLITIHHEWRTIYQVSSALIGLVLVLVFFTFPETSYHRVPDESDSSIIVIDLREENDSSRSHTKERRPSPTIHHEDGHWKVWKVWNGSLTNEGLFKMFVRPFVLIFLPPVLWAALIQAVTIGFLVAVSSNIGAAFDAAYEFEAYQSGLCFVSAIIGSLLGIPAGGHFGDKVADYLTQRNGGIREPEMRLPVITLSMITTPMALVLYGVGIQHKLHWVVPSIGLGLLNFSITQAASISLVYVIDAYRPVAGEVSLAVLGFKSMFGFLLSFYTNPWINMSGYQNAFGAMAGIAASVLIMWVPFYFWGKRIRHITWHWPLISYIHWDDDREVGE
ncbi:major facilitator superfamily domain-containing protein [Dactylonectria estremocensis]|uniref:Major facilitator superfamily domain-containing protein n=1 Tax=Dactylonectria estremocensis TaxID=1079267 RepID=A0A9P9FKN5_9HYPO|nr:major facilitator superfamily domain-containing protein [Dactylonectria estremocensis]